MHDSTKVIWGDDGPEIFFPYSFPVKEVMPELLDAPTAKLASKLGTLSYERVSCASELLPYRLVRSKLCMLSLALNEQGVIAPRFRSMRKPLIKHGSCVTEEDRDISNDRQMIDLHWLHCRWRNGDRLAVNTMESKWRAIFEEETFNFGLAEQFVSNRGRVEDKVGALCLTEKEQWQLAVVQRDAIRQKWRRINEARPEAVATLRANAEQNRQLRQGLEAWIDSWVAAQIAESQPSLACEFYGLMTGKSENRKTMSRRLKRLQVLT